MTAGRLEEKFLSSKKGVIPPTEDHIFGVIGLNERYCIRSNKWHNLPKLQMERYSHSSCIAGATLFVFCGRDKNQDCTNSIEKLSLTSQTTQT